MYFHLKLQKYKLYQINVAYNCTNLYKVYVSADHLYTCTGLLVECMDVYQKLGPETCWFVIEIHHLGS